MNSQDRFEKLMDIFNDRGCVFSLELNMNDVFGWACAESGEMDASDLEEVFPIYEKYGSWTFIAYEAIRRGNGCRPAHGDDKEPKYLAAKAELEELAKDGTILFTQFWERTRAEREKNDQTK